MHVAELVTRCHHKDTFFFSHFPFTNANGEMTFSIMYINFISGKNVKIKSLSIILNLV